MVPSGIGREALVCGTGAARGRCQMLPHLLVVGAGNSGDPGPAGRGRRLSGEHSGGCAARSGRRSGVAAATFGVLLNTARPDGIEYQKRRGAFKSPYMDRGPQGSAVQWCGGGGRSRTLRRSVRESAATATGVWETPTRYVQEGDREESSLKKKTTVLWPRRGRRGLRQHCCSIFRRLLQIAYRTYWVRELQQPRSFQSGPVRRGASDRTTRPRMSSRDEELKGKSNESVADGGIGLQTSAGRGRGGSRATIRTIAFDAYPRATARSYSWVFS